MRILNQLVYSLSTVCIAQVTSPDGDSCTGQTPDIAWENFQKKSCPKVKNWLGKRFSSKIDGVEASG